MIDETPSRSSSAARRCRRAISSTSAIEAADLIVNVGHDVIEKPPFFMQRGGAEVIHVSTRTAEVDPVYFPQIEVIGDIANAIWQMKEDIVPSRDLEVRPDAGARARPRSSTPPRMCGDERFPIFPPYLVERSARRCRPTASSASTMASTRSGSRATIRRASRTPCCSTMRWRRWARACPRRWRRRWSIPTAR